MLLEEYNGLNRLVLQAVRAAVDVPARFGKSKALGAHFGLVPRTHQSGEFDRTGRISQCNPPASVGRGASDNGLRTVYVSEAPKPELLCLRNRVS